MRTRTGQRFAALLIAATLALAACGSSGSGGSGGSGGGGGSAASHTTLNAVMAQQATDISPLTATQQGKGQVLSLLGTPLLQSDDQAKIFSRLLTSWDTSADAKTVTLKLKPNLKWSDGKPITTADIVTTLNIYLDTSVSAGAGRIGGVAGQDELGSGKAKTLSGVKATDESTVTVTLQKPDVAWTANLAALAFNLPLLPDHVLGTIAHDQLAANDYFKSYPVSSGPFTLTKFVQDQYAEFTRNDNYFGTKPSFEKVFLKASTTDAMTADLQTGASDFIFPLDPADVERIKSISGVTVNSHQGVAPELLEMNNASPKLKDPRIRQALIYAIDRAGICKQALAGQCTTPLTNIRQISPAWSIPTTGLISYDYNPEKAKELLKEAGWDPNTELVLMLAPGRSYIDKATTILQGNLAAAGVKVAIKNVDTGQVLDTWKKQDDSWQLAWNSGADFTLDPVAWQTYASCAGRFPAGGNTSQYCDPELDKLWAAGRTETDQAKRAQIYQQAFTMLNKNPAEIYLYVVNSMSASNSHIQGIKPHGNLTSPYWNIEDWTWKS